MNFASFLLGFMGGVISGLLIIDTINHLRPLNEVQSKNLGEITYIDDIELQ